MWTNMHSGLRWLGVSLIWAGAGQYLQTRVYVERRVLLIRRVAQGLGGRAVSPAKAEPDPDPSATAMIARYRR